MPIIRPGEPSKDIGYEEYLKGTEEYFSQKQETAERAAKIGSRVKRGRLGLSKDRMARVAHARMVREYKEREKVLGEKDAPEYAEAEAARPVYSGIGGIEHRGVLSAWVEKYSPVLGRGSERYKKETTFLEEQQSAIKTGMVKEETKPYGLGRDVGKISVDETKYNIVEKYDTGEPKKIVQKSEKYITRREKPGRGAYTYSYGEYTPYEAELNKDGTLKKELNREIVETKWDVRSNNSQYNTYTPIVKGELTYEKGIPKELIGRSTYRSEFYQSPKTIRTYSDYKPYESSRVTFTDEGEISEKKVFGVGKKSSEGIDKWGGRYTKTPYLKDHYEFEEGQKTTFPKPVERESRTGQYYRDIEARNKPVVRKEVAWYNPYTQKGKTHEGTFYKTTGPKINRLRGPNYAIESPKTGKMISWKTHPFTEKPFKSGQDFESFWKKREGMVGSLSMRQDLSRTFKKDEGIIPPGYWGTSSKTYGQVSPGGSIEKMPAELVFGKYFWKR